MDRNTSEINTLQVNEAEGEPLIINGVECIPWTHPQEGFPRNLYYKNTASVIETLDNRGGSVISIDGFLSGMMLKSINDSHTSVNGEIIVSTANNPEVIQMLGKIEDKQEILLLGDFITQFGYHNLVKDQNTEVLTSGLLIGGLSVLETAMALKNMKLTRREFMGKGALLLGATLALNSLGGLAITNKYYKEVEDNINSQGYSNISAKISEVYNDPELADNVARTGIMIAKQNLLAESQLLSSLGVTDIKGQVSVWGTAHLNTQEDITLIKKISSNPAPYAKAILERETAFLVGIGKGMQEVTEEVGWLRMCMAGIVPTRVQTSEGETKIVSLAGHEQNILFDKRILGFDPMGMSFQQIKNRSMVKGQALYFALTDRDGNLKI